MIGLFQALKESGVQSAEQEHQLHLLHGELLPITVEAWGMSECRR